MLKDLETELIMSMQAISGNRVRAVGNLDDIFKAVEQALGLSYHDLNSKRRFRDLVEGRYIAYHLIKKELYLEASKICVYFSKDRTTVLHGLQKFNDFIETDKLFQKKFYEVNNRLNNQPFYEN